MQKDIKRYGILVITWLVMVGIWILPGIQHKNFYQDWYNHSWIINYFSDYFANNYCFPNVINTNNHTVGFVMPIYYGRELYEVLGLLAVIVGSSRRALVLGVAVVLSIQWYLWGNVIKKVNSNLELWSYALSFIWTVSNYQITNFYIRGAITEFFAVALLNIAIACWILALNSISLADKIRNILIVTIIIPTLFYIHPITGMNACVFMFILGLFTINRIIDKKMNKVYVSVCFIAISLCLASIVLPFIYLQVKFPSTLGESGAYLTYYDGIDSIWARMSLMPFDKRVYITGINTSTPNLCAPINMLLFGLNIYLLYQILRKDIELYKKVKIILWNAFMLVLLVISVCPVLGDYIPKILKLVQFPYRWVNFIDLFLVCSIVEEIKIFDSKKILQKFILFSLVIMFQTTIIHNYQIDAIADKMIFEPFENREDVGINVKWGFVDDSNESYKLGSPNYMPESFAAEFAYKNFSEYSQQNEIDVSLKNIITFDIDMKNTIKVLPKEIYLDNDDLIGVRVYPHPWNGIFLDGQRINNEGIVCDLTHVYDNHPIYIRLPKGKHTLEYKFSPDKMYIYLMQIKVFIQYLLVIAVLLLSIISWLRVYFSENKQENK